MKEIVINILIFGLLLFCYLTLIFLVNGVTRDSKITNSNAIEISGKYYRCYEKKVEE